MVEASISGEDRDTLLRNKKNVNDKDKNKKDDANVEKSKATSHA